MSLDPAISKLIGDIYRDVRDPIAWTGVLDRILALTRSRFLMISAVDLRIGEYCQTYWHGWSDADWARTYALAEDDWRNLGADFMAWWRGENERFTAVYASIGGKRRDPSITPWAAERFGEPQQEK